MNEEMMMPVQNAHTNPTIEFRNGQALFKMKSLGGTDIERLVSFEAIREAATNIPVDSGWIGPEIVRWGNGSRGEWLVAFFPPGRYELELTEGTPGPEEKLVRIAAPLPGMVIFGAAVKYWIWAVKTERFEPHHEIYRCPLPNVMQDASVCWGMLKPPQASPRSMLKTWEIFHKSTFNNHAASGKSKRCREDVRELLKELASVEAGYPVDDLVRQVEGEGTTLDKAIREFWGTGLMPG